MQTTKNRHLSRTLLALSVTLASAAWADYAIYDLGRISGAAAPGISPNAINNDGIVVGVITTAGGQMHPASYDGTQITDLSQYIGSYAWSRAVDISNSGNITGIFGSSNSDYRAFIISNGVASFSGTLGGHLATALGVNDSGDVVGWSTITNDTYSPAHAFIYNNGIMVDIGTLGGTSATATAINSSGTVTGYSTGPANSTLHPFIYSNGVMTDLGTLGGTIALAWSINDVGQVTGYSLLSTGDSHGFIYDNGTMTDIGTLGGDFSYPLAINNNGDVVGYGNKIPLSNTDYPFLYSNGVMVDVNTLLPANSGWTLNNANDINDYGQIVGTGTVNGEIHGYMLSPGC